MLKKFPVNVSFRDALSQMPLYAKFLKEILTKKRKVDEHESVALGKECSAIVLNKLPAKRKDPGRFSIPCMIGSFSIDRAYAILVLVNLMLYSIFKRLSLDEVKPINISVQLADHSIKYPLGILEDVPIKVGEFHVPINFLILDMEKGSCTQIILGRPFLATTRCK